MKPFNLEEAKAGKRMVTRDGREVEFIAYVPSASEGLRVVCLVTMTDSKHIYCYHDNGKYTRIDDSILDLCMYEEPSKKSMRYLWGFRQVKPKPITPNWQLQLMWMTEEEAKEQFASRDNRTFEFFKMEETARELDD